MMSTPEIPMEAQSGVVWTTPGEAGALIGRSLGNYRLEGLLGIGGMAEV